MKKSDIFRKRKKRSDGGMVEERSRPHHPRERREHKTHLNWHCNGRQTDKERKRERERDDSSPFDPKFNGSGPDV